jgi:hypothetical protein
MTAKRVLGCPVTVLRRESATRSKLSEGDSGTVKYQGSWLKSIKNMSGKIKPMLPQQPYQLRSISKRKLESPLMRLQVRLAA